MKSHYETLLDEQEMVLARVQELVDDMQNYEVTMTRLIEMDVHLKTLTELEKQLEFIQILEDEEARLEDERAEFMERIEALQT